MMEADEQHNLAVVRRVCSHWHELTREQYAELLSEGCVYINMPWHDRKNIGPDAAIDYLTFLRETYITEVETLVEIVDGERVMSERVERFRRRTDGTIVLDLPVTGVFSVRGGRIAEWRDYFDSQQAKILRATELNDPGPTPE